RQSLARAMWSGKSPPAKTRPKTGAGRGSRAVSGAGSPLWFRHALLQVFIARHDKERVGEAVEVGQYMLTDGFFTGEGGRFALGTATNRARHMQLRRTQRATGENKILQRLKLGAHFIDQ